MEARPFVKLLAWLRNETWAETQDYLLVEYRVDLQDIDALQLRLDLDLKRRRNGNPWIKAYSGSTCSATPIWVEEGSGNRSSACFTLVMTAGTGPLRFPGTIRPGILLM